MNDKKSEIKRENRKALKRFLVIIVVSGFIGGVIGGTLGFFELSLREVSVMMVDFVARNSIYMMIVVFIVSQVYGWMIYKKSKKMLNVWDGEDEDTADKIDVNIGYIMWDASVGLILCFLLFSFSVGITENHMGGNHVFFVFVVFVLNIIGILLLQQKSVDLTKEMNPEKKGSIYDSDFQKKWLESCDEAERMQTYQCAWEAYKVMQIAYVVAWVITFLAKDIFGTGIFSCFMVTMLWLLHTSVYCYKAVHVGN